MFRTLKRCPAPLRWRLARTASPISLQSLRQTIASSQTPSSSSEAVRAVRAFHCSSACRQNAAAAVEETETEYQGQTDDAVAMGPAKTFAELADRGLVDRGVIRTITEKMGLETMTQVQSLTLNEALRHKDVLAQARTGTGKTLGFLLPVLQNIITSDPELAVKKFRRARGGDAGDIRAIIISPTRELAEQIAVEAKKLTQDTNVVVQTAVGGTQKRFHLRKMQKEGCHILVGTPGRIKDVFSDPDTRVAAPALDSFVLDEADRLLDQGFWPEIQAIQELLPTLAEKDRQTLMYSATVPKDVVQLARTTMKPDLHYVRTVQENEEPTHERVKQMLAVVPSLENQLPAVLELCDREIKAADDAIRESRASGSTTKHAPFKAIVYCNATAETHLASSILVEHRLSERSDPENTILGPTRIYEIHGRLSQQQRTAAAEYFRAAHTGILVSSDVTSRGMDFPGVTHIIQIGLPQERDTYIHRLGRTARAGAEGQGWLILPAPSLNEARTRLGKLPLQRDATLETAAVDYASAPEGQEPAMSDTARRYFSLVRDAAARLGPRANFDDAYMALVGTFQWMRNKAKLIEMMNRVATVQWGLQEPPSLSPGLVARLGLRNTPGLRVGGGRSEGGDRERGGRGGFGERERSGGFGDRPARSGGFGGRSERGGSSYGDRPERTGGFGGRSERGGSSFGDRPERTGGFGGRSDRGGNSDGDRPERSGSFGGRSERGGSSFGDRPERSGSFGGRSERGGSSFGERPERSGGFGGRSERGGSYGNRPERSSGFGGRGAGYGGRGGGSFGGRGRTGGGFSDRGGSDRSGGRGRREVDTGY